MAYGVTDTGFVLKPLAQIKADLEASFKATFGASIDLSPDGPFGQIIGILAGSLAEEWEQMQSIYNNAYPDTASGAALDNLCALTGITRLPAKPTKVTAILVGTAGTVVALGKVASVASVATSRFDLDATVTISALTAWAGTTVYAAGALRTASGNVYYCVVGGTSGGVAPSTTGTAIVDGTVTWRYIAAGTAAVAAALTCELTGPTACNAGTLSVIETPVAGWNAVSNPADGTLGSNIETNPALRNRRAASVTAPGSSSVNAIRADVLAVAGVTSCVVYENVTDATDGQGRPPHSIEALVQGGTDAAVAAAIFGSKGGGLNTFGSTSSAVLDSQGISHTINFNRPTPVPIYITVNMVKAAATWPADGPTQVTNALLTYGLTMAVGQPVNDALLYAPVLTVLGVADITNIRIGLAPAPGSSANLVLALRELAVFDSARVVVNVT